MTRNRIFAVSIVAILTLCLAITWGQQGQFQPSVGQAGKDVIWVPTPPELISAMLEMAKVTPNDLLMDLGSGDGRIVIAAAKLGTTAIGVEYENNMVELSRANAQKEGVANKATFIQGDIFETDFSKATVLTMYLLPSLNMKLREAILNMKPGTRVVSHAFNMEDWEPDQTANVEGRTAYFWVVPAKVAGTWRWQSGNAVAELTLDQTFQKIAGRLRLGTQLQDLKDAKLDGAHITFTAGDLTYSGTVNGDSIVGTSQNAAASNTAQTRAAVTKWTAQKR